MHDSRHIIACHYHLLLPLFLVSSLLLQIKPAWSNSYWSEFTLRLLARISHHPSTATAPWHALAGFRSVGVLDIVSTMPARSSVAKATQAAPLHRLATNGGEKCGLGGEQLPVHRVASQGSSLLIWLPSEFGLHPQAKAPVAKQLAARGIEVWMPDLYSAYFVQQGRENLESFKISDLLAVVRHIDWDSAEVRNTIDRLLK